MSVATVAAVGLYAAYPDARDEYLLVWIVALSMGAALAATLLTRPTAVETRARFVEQVRPPGWWGIHGGAAHRRAMALLAVGWVCGNVAVFGLMFGIGYVVLGEVARGLILVAVGAVAIPATLAMTRRSRAELGDGEGEGKQSRQLDERQVVGSAPGGGA